MDMACVHLAGRTSNKNTGIILEQIDTILFMIAIDAVPYCYN